MMKKLKQLSIIEIIMYSILILLGLWGFIYLILGFICEFLNIHSGLRYADNYIRNVFGTGFLVCGLIVLGVSVAASVVVLLLNAKKSDRDYEKAQRRAARLKKKPEVVDVSPEKVEVSE